MQLLELHGIEATVVGRHGGASTLGKARAELSRVPALRTLGEAARLRPRARARLARPDADRPLARDPERDDVRLRVRLAPAPARLPRGDAGRRPRGDPARAARPLRRAAAEAAPLPGPEGGVLPRRLRARRRSTSRRASALVVVRTPPEVSLYHRHGNPLFRRRARAARPGRRASTPSSCRARTSSARRSARSASRRCVVPDRAVDAQSLIAAAAVVVSAGRDDEPRGGRARNARLHDVRRPARRRRRGADPRRPARSARATRPTSTSTRSRRGASGYDATRTSCSTCCLGERGEHLLAVALELRRPDAGDGGELGEAPRPPAGDLLERRVVEDDVGRDLVGPRAGEPPRLQRLEARSGFCRGGAVRRRRQLARGTGSASSPR